MSAINYSELDYKRPGSKGTYIYPDWAVGIGWALAATSAIWIPIVALYKWIKNGANMEVGGSDGWSVGWLVSRSISRLVIS